MPTIIRKNNNKCIACWFFLIDRYWVNKLVKFVFVSNIFPLWKDVTSSERHSEKQTETNNKIFARFGFINKTYTHIAYASSLYKTSYTLHMTLLCIYFIRARIQNYFPGEKSVTMLLENVGYRDHVWIGRNLLHFPALRLLKSCRIRKQKYCIFSALRLKLVQIKCISHMAAIGTYFLCARI